MTKFGNKYGTTPKVGRGPIQTVGRQTVANHEGAASFARDAKSDLFLLAVTNFVSEDTFYESAQSRDNRFVKLVHEVTAVDPGWVARFVPWLRNEANMRSASVVMACEYTKAGGPNPRAVINSACSRADEPGEVLAYWIGVHGRPVPSSVKRGVSDAADRLWNEYSVGKYDGGRVKFRLGDVVNMARPKPKTDDKAALYKYVQDTRFGATPDVSRLPMLDARRAVNSGEITRDQLLADPALLKSAGMTWEALSGLGAMDAAAWEAVIPNMGYMALLRNLRNFEEAGISAKVSKYVNDYLSDPEKVAKSRQLPFRFWSAYKNTSGLKYASAIEAALNSSLQNIPAFDGKTLVLLDTSASMRGTYSNRGSISPVEAGAVFSAAIALSGRDVTLRQFATSVADIKVQKGGSVLREAEKITRAVGSVGHGTDIARAMASYNGQDRVVLITDMQTQRAFTRKQSGIPTHVPIFGFNLSGNATTQIGGDVNEYELGGLTDQTFKLLPLLEARGKGDYPF